MARLAVLASGNGSNFQAIVEALRSAAAGRHECALLVHDRRAACAAERAAKLGVPSLYVGYYKRDPLEAEAEISAALAAARADLVALAGFMRILSPDFAAAWRGRMLNIHPSLLPEWPGAHAIERAYEAGEREFGVTVHFVDEGMDTGPVIDQARFARSDGMTLGEVEARVHEIEHEIYPRAVLERLDGIEKERRGR